MHTNLNHAERLLLAKLFLLPSKLVIHLAVRVVLPVLDVVVLLEASTTPEQAPKGARTRAGALVRAMGTQTHAHLCAHVHTDIHTTTRTRARALTLHGVPGPFLLGCCTSCTPFARAS